MGQLVGFQTSVVCMLRTGRSPAYTDWKAPQRPDDNVSLFYFFSVLYPPQQRRQARMLGSLLCLALSLFLSLCLFSSTGRRRSGLHPVTPRVVTSTRTWVLTICTTSQTTGHFSQGFLGCTPKVVPLKGLLNVALMQPLYEAM